MIAVVLVGDESLWGAMLECNPSNLLNCAGVRVMLRERLGCRVSPSLVSFDCNSFRRSVIFELIGDDVLGFGVEAACWPCRLLYVDDELSGEVLGCLALMVEYKYDWKSKGQRNIIRGYITCQTRKVTLNNLNLSLLVDDVWEPGDLVIVPLRHDNKPFYSSRYRTLLQHQNLQFASIVLLHLKYS
jgi:hypothetical protein